MRWRRAIASLFSLRDGLPRCRQRSRPQGDWLLCPVGRCQPRSLQLHATELQAVVPAWISVTGPDHKVTIAADPAGRTILRGLPEPSRLWLMVQNALMGTWNGPDAAALLHDTGATDTVLDQIEAEAISDKAAGLVIDFEDLPANAQPDLVAFLNSARDRCRRHGWLLAVTAPVSNPDWDLPRLAGASDRVILMAYDEHWQSGAAGPIASRSWFTAAVRRAIAQIAPTKAVVAIASYAYDWPVGESRRSCRSRRPRRWPASRARKSAKTGQGAASTSPIPWPGSCTRSGCPGRRPWSTKLRSQTRREAGALRCGGWERRIRESGSTLKPSRAGKQGLSHASPQAAVREASRVGRSADRWRLCIL